MQLGGRDYPRAHGHDEHGSFATTTVYAGRCVFLMLEGCAKLYIVLYIRSVV